MSDCSLYAPALNNQKNPFPSFFFSEPLSLMTDYLLQSVNLLPQCASSNTSSIIKLQ